MGRKALQGAEGRMGRLFIDGNELCVTEFNFTEIAEEEESTNSCSGGKKEFEAGSTHIEGSVTAQYDIAANFFDDPPLIRAGLKKAADLYLHSAPGNTPSGSYLQADAILINNVATTVPQKGFVTYTFNFKTSGDYDFQVAEDSSGA